MDDDIRRFELMRNMFVADNEIRLKMMLKGYTNEEIDGFFRGEKLPSKAPAPQVPPPASTVSPPATPSQPPKPRIKSENRSVPLLANNGLDRYRYLLMRDMNVPDSKIREKMMINGMSKEDIDKFFEEYPNPNPEPESEMNSSASKSMRSTPRGNSPGKRPLSEAVDPFQLDLSAFVKTLRNNVADDVIRTKMESAGFSVAEIEALLSDTTNISTGSDLRASPMLRSNNSSTSSRPVSTVITMNLASPSKSVPKQITMSVGSVDLKAAPGFFRAKSVRLQEGVNRGSNDDDKQRQSLKATMTSDYSDNSDINNNNNNPASSKDMENRKSAHLNNLTQFSGKSTISSSFRVTSSRSININNSTNSSGNNNGNGNGNNNNKGSFDKLTSSTASASARLPGTNEEQFDRDSNNSGNSNSNNNNNNGYERFRASEMSANDVHRSSLFSSLRWMFGISNNNNNNNGKSSFSNNNNNNSMMNPSILRASPGPKNRGVRRSKSLHLHNNGKESRFASLFKRNNNKQQQQQQQQGHKNGSTNSTHSSASSSSGKVIRL